MKRHSMRGLMLSAGVALSVLAGSAFSTQAQVKLGVGGPITGGSAAFGAQLKNGAEQAAADINAAGGILGQQIQIFVGDDASKPEQGVSAGNKFVGDGVKYVVGHFNSGVSIPVSAEVYNENGILQITPASTNPTFTERGLWNVFRTCGRDDQQGAVAADYIVSKMKDKRIAVLHDKTPYGKGLADETKKAMNAKGVKEVVYEGINPGERDYRAVVTKLKAQRVDLLFWGGLHPEAGVLLSQMREQGLTTVMMGGDGIAAAELAAIAGDAVEGTLMTFGPDPTKRPDAAAIVKKFTDKNINPESYTLYSYASVQVIKQAAEKANSLDTKKVAEVMHSGMTFDTVIGKFSFNKKGDRNDADYVMYVWKKMPDGKMSYVEM
ncbi:MAG: branched-chain amino acid ABC transporter substrate-binding protein [Beijerinckiaceae bacterium]|nr:branched-chain amino acid ABC transporter substrate-binding protein [Beijerinckiaceae bacterium]